MTWADAHSERKERTSNACHQKEIHKLQSLPRMSREALVAVAEIDGEGIKPTSAGASSSYMLPLGLSGQFHIVKPVVLLPKSTLGQ